MAKPDTEPSLADKFVADIGRWQAAFGFKGSKIRKHVDQVGAAYRADIRKASRFVLDNDFVRFASEVSTTTGAEKLLYRLQYATLPYETTWIEFNSRLKVEIIRAIHRPEDDFTDIHEVPARMGMLMYRLDQTKWLCQIVCENLEVHDLPVIPNMLSYFVSTTEHDFEADGIRYGCQPISKYAAGVQRPVPAKMLAKASLWGYSDSKEQGVLDGRANVRWNMALPSYLERHGEMGFSRSFDIFYDRLKDEAITGAKSSFLDRLDKMSNLIITEMREFTGFMRWAVTVLAMLNEVPIRSHLSAREGQYNTRMGSRKFLDYHTVTLHVPKTNPVRYVEHKLSNREAAKKRAHEVRSHWRTYLDENPCRREDHAWEYDEDHGYRLCGRCMAFSRLIHEHVRGDPSLGWVRKDYVVKKAPRA